MLTTKPSTQMRDLQKVPVYVYRYIFFAVASKRRYRAQPGFTKASVKRVTEPLCSFQRSISPMTIISRYTSCLQLRTSDASDALSESDSPPRRFCSPCLRASAESCLVRSEPPFFTAAGPQSSHNPPLSNVNSPSPPARVLQRLRSRLLQFGGQVA